MLPLFQYVVMDRSGTSVRSSRRRRGAKPLAVAAAAKQCCGNLQMDLFASVVWFGRKGVRLPPSRVLLLLKLSVSV